MSRDLKAARAEVASLTDELAGLEALAERHATAARDAARAHRQGGATADELQAAVSARQAIAYARDQIRAELADAHATLAELESAADDEQHLAVIAAGTVAYHEAEAEHRAILTEAEHVLARALARSPELSRAASAARTQASDAAHTLAAKHSAARGDMLARAVNGSAVPPLTDHAGVTKWPYGNRQTYKLVSQVEPRRRGVVVPLEGGDGA